MLSTGPYLESRPQQGLSGQRGNNQLLDHDYLYAPLLTTICFAIADSCCPVNITTDVLIICLPISMVMKLTMPLKQKLGVASIFGLGFVVVIASSMSPNSKEDVYF